MQCVCIHAPGPNRRELVPGRGRMHLSEVPRAAHAIRALHQEFCPLNAFRSLETLAQHGLQLGPHIDWGPLTLSQSPEAKAIGRSEHGWSIVLEGKEEGPSGESVAEVGHGWLSETLR